MDNRTFKITSTNNHVPLKITPGHFATNHSHINYYLDVTTLKARMSEARQAAEALAGMYMYDTVVDTIVCLDGTQIIGAYLAEALTNAGVMSRNAHQTIYVIAPEYNSNSQMVFRENTQPMVTGKNASAITAGFWPVFPPFSLRLRRRTEFTSTAFSACAICRTTRRTTTATVHSVRRGLSWMRW